MLLTGYFLSAREALYVNNVLSSGVENSVKLSSVFNVVNTPTTANTEIAVMVNIPNFLFNMPPFP